MLKTKITLLVTVIAQFSGRKTNLEKAIYFFSIMSFSINKLKSHLFFTCQNLCFVVLCRKNFLLKVMVVVVVLCVCGGWAVAPPWLASLLSLQLCIVLKDYPHHLTKYEDKGDKILNFQSFL